MAREFAYHAFKRSFATSVWRRSMNGSPEWTQAFPSAVHSILCCVKARLFVMLVSCTLLSVLLSKYRTEAHPWPLRGNLCVWAITRLCFSPPTFIHFSLFVTSITLEMIPNFPGFQYSKRQKAGRGLGTRLLWCMHKKHVLKYSWLQYSSCYNYSNLIRLVKPLSCTKMKQLLAV